MGKRFVAAVAVGLGFLVLAGGPSWGQEPLVLVDSQGWRSGTEDGLSTLKAELTNAGLIVKSTAEVAGFASPPLSEALLSGALVVIIDRRDSYPTEEINAVDQYVWNGGSLLCSMDSDVSPNFIPAANSLLVRFGMNVLPEGETGESAFLAEHPVNANISSVVNDDGPVNISCRLGTALARVGEAVVALASEQGYGKVGVVDADIIYDGEGKNIGLGDNKAFATNLVLWLAGKQMAAAPTPPIATVEKGKRLTCPLCDGALLLTEEGNLEVAPP